MFTTGIYTSQYYLNTLHLMLTDLHSRQFLEWQF